MSVLDLIGQRFSARSYKPDRVEEEKLQQVLEAARLAPTAANRQPFKLVVVRTEGRQEELRRIYDKEWFVEAPLILGVCNVLGKGWVRKDGKQYGEVDAAIVMDHIILAAADLGLATCWIGAFQLQAARDVLELDKELEPIAFTPLGYTDDTALPKVRKPLEDLVIYR